MRIFQKLNVYQKNTSNPVKQYTYIVKTTRENKEQINSLEKKPHMRFYVVHGLKSTVYVKYKNLRWNKIKSIKFKIEGSMLAIHTTTETCPVGVFNCIIM